MSDDANDTTPARDSSANPIELYSVNNKVIFYSSANKSYMA